MEGVVIDAAFWKGRRVLVTGHTGFKGSWLSLWLQSMGAQVAGYALAPPTEPSLFALARVAGGMQSRIADVRDIEAVRAALQAFRPAVVFHLAAQSVVRASYEEPVETYATNVMGTVNVLEAVRACNETRAVVVVTSDKCYDNREWDRGYREDDALGGRDPYSSSKGCAELVTAAYRASFFDAGAAAIASARAGNVIGGGDWTRDRLVPDLMRAAADGAVTRIRNPDAVRPWQHVLEPLAGYLLLAERLCGPEARRYAAAWNFGPHEADCRPVGWVAARLAEHWGGLRWEVVGPKGPHEARFLKLDSAKAIAELGWRPRWDLDRALRTVAAWHKAHLAGADLRRAVLDQVCEYTATNPQPATTR